MMQTRVKISKSLLLLLMCFYGHFVYAQMASKPSYYDHKRQESRLLAQPQSQSASANAALGILWRNEVLDRQGFDTLTRVYHQGTPFEIPHVIFVIDREDNEKIYYLNTPHFELHENFIRHLLKAQISRAEMNRNYDVPDRRFIFGTLSWQNLIGGYTYEFWDGDKLTPQLLSITENRLKVSFFSSVQFKSNSTWHEEVAKSLSLKYIAQHELIKEQNFMTLSTGHAWGRLLVIRSEGDWEGVTEKDIVLLKDVPISIPPVGGVITERPSTVLSHVNVLANSWKIPNVYLRDAEKILAPLVGQSVKFTAYIDNYHIEAAEQNQTVLTQNVTQLPKPNVTSFHIKPLAALTAKDSIYCGAKAANLGAIKNKIRTVMVPDGFCIPFAYYHQFMSVHGLENILKEMESQPSFKGNSLVRKKALEELRDMIMSWDLDPDLMRKVAQQWQEQLNGHGVFVRSSSNSEDLPHFSGAGLYTTTPNVKTTQALEEAIKRSWASVFNFEAYEARRVARLPQNSVMMSVLVQVAVDADASGVLITQNPFDRTKTYMTYIAAKRGVGIRVVEGQRIAEQVMYSSFSKAVQVLTYSEEETALQLDERGGVREVLLNVEPRVLTDELVVRLTAEGYKIKLLFSGVAQDIEWAVKDGKIIILQARPFI
ncbi:MAG: PEP/pyruvate-binding domain-containing protein [Saezia sp.]